MKITYSMKNKNYLLFFNKYLLFLHHNFKIRYNEKDYIFRFSTH
ncbi:conserved hypothetical protein [Capnocytophaga canimorsus]|uniref:Uncharacterized protein n=1 Tax=Capnocytophaga canimorsus TaxID=28188 RepID=A0A0B7IMN0_9FLAO|nr:conserved hypothetical protein [Capnocytophaga canimorsus]